MKRAQTPIPRLRLGIEEPVAQVVGWGVVDGLILQPGDRLLLGAVWDRSLAILRPWGRGELSLGRRIQTPQGEQLQTEPGGRPASPQRWSVVAGVLAVERPISSGILGLERWYLPSRLDRGGGRGLGPLCLEQHLRRLRPDGSAGLVVGRSVLAAEALPPRPGWARYVLLPPHAELIAGPWVSRASSQQGTGGDGDTPAQANRSVRNAWGA